VVSSTGAPKSRRRRCEREYKTALKIYDRQKARAVCKNSFFVSNQLCYSAEVTSAFSPFARKRRNARAG
jgi:hypothetical protein